MNGLVILSEVEKSPGQYEGSATGILRLCFACAQDDEPLFVMFT